MPQAFLSYSWKDKSLVDKVADFLSKSFMKVWLDSDELSGGVSLSREILAGIKKADCFVAFITNNYFKSDWCLEEFDRVYNLFIKKKVKILPVLLQPRTELDFNLNKDRSNVIDDLLDRTAYIEIDKYNTAPGIKKIADSIWKGEAIRFEPIQEKEIDGQKVQLIQFRLQGKLESNFLETWDFNIESLLAQSDENNDNKPIVDSLPVAFNGAGPIWLSVSMVVHLKNRRTIFVYNKPDNEYICAYSLPGDNMLGRVLKANS